MATTATISARSRESRGKGAARQTRRQGRIPGVLYGHGEDSVALSVDANDLHRLVHTISIENTIVDLDLGSGEPYKVLIRELQRHPFRDEFVHIDFFHVAMDEKIQVEVPIVLVGTPTGVKNKGGVLDHQLRELEVFCLPGSIPEKIELEVSNLDIGDSIHVSDIQLPDVEILTELDRAVVAVLAPTVMEVEEVAEEALAEPEVIGRGKEAEGEEEAGGTRREREEGKE
ncbi:MAG TPA: 50S ribosomal protein L25/general stress protein Ctc [Gemmatimonadota bacterium]|jgi:large subunit ribosomal protein L25|nr:50S ribosomal protein L25/general stress protein Ctc [Gemmatimonadota bacterium]